MLDEETAAKAQAIATYIGLHTSWKWEPEVDGFRFHTQIHSQMFIGFDQLDLALENAEHLRKETAVKLHKLIILGKKEES